MHGLLCHEYTKIDVARILQTRGLAWWLEETQRCPFQIVVLICQNLCTLSHMEKKHAGVLEKKEIYDGLFQDVFVLGLADD